MKILTIVGPTAVGKTEIAVKIARRISGEIISADSRQIYKYLDIGTAKPTARQRKQATFHLVGFAGPADDYSCGQFARDAQQKIGEIRKKNKNPIVCGGTGLYIKALFHPLDQLPRSNAETKTRLREMMEKHGIEYLYRRLRGIDPDWAERIQPQDKQRIFRGIEVYEVTGRPLSKMLGKAARKTPLLPYYIGLCLPRDVLYSRISSRFDHMIKAGLVQETESLLRKGFSPESSALRTIGYKEIVGYLLGSTSLETAIEIAKRRTRNYAKRQMTWFKKMPEIEWHDPGESEIIERILAIFKKTEIAS
jgi:tRNA dimethylallyltransferase